MSYANRKNRPDSRDVAKLREEYEVKVRQFRDTHDAGTRAKLKDEKQKSFQRVVDQVNAERRDDLGEAHKVLIRMGKYKTDDMIKAEKQKAEAAKAANVTREQRA